jgi:Kef-type K+ transport system membrane component KefB
MQDPGHFSEATAISLLLLSGGAFSIPLLCRPLKLPAAVGEIIFGVLVGPYALGWVEVTDFIRLVAELGFFLLMFIGGLELDFTQIEKGGVRPLGRSLLITILMLVVSLVVTSALGFGPFVSLVLSAVSIGIPLVLLHETGLGRQRFGQDLLLVGSVGEFFLILVATGVSAHGATGGLGWPFVLELLKLTSVFAMAYLLLVILRTLVWWKSESFARIVTYHDPSEIGVRAGLALMFAFVAVAAFLHIEPILGAFIAGALFSFVFRAKGPLELKFMSIGNGFFVPFFFISVGLNFDLQAASRGNVGVFLQLLLCLLLIRLVCFALARPRHWSARHVVAGALLYSAPLTLLVVIANLGRSLGMLDATFHATVILLAVTSSTLYPFLFKLVARTLPSQSNGSAA